MKKRTCVPFYSDAQRSWEDTAKRLVKIGIPANDERVKLHLAEGHLIMMGRASRWGASNKDKLRKKLLKTGLHKHPRLPKSLKASIRNMFPFGV